MSDTGTILAPFETLLDFLIRCRNTFLKKKYLNMYLNKQVEFIQIIIINMFGCH